MTYYNHVCPLCDKYFISKRTLREHDVTHYNYVCPMCDKYFISKRTLKEHDVTHYNFVCPLCDQQCLPKTTLKVHDVTHYNLFVFKKYKVSKNWNVSKKYVCQNMSPRIHLQKYCQVVMSLILLNVNQFGDSQYKWPFSFHCLSPFLHNN